MVSQASYPRIEPLGDSAVIVRLGDRIDRATFEKVRALSQRFDQRGFPGLIERLPAYASIAVHYDPRRILYEEVCAWLESALAELQEAAPPAPRVVEIPVCYGGRYGCDLDFVAQHAGIATEEVVEIHSQAEYLTCMIGFAPGFPYLGGMSPRIAAPRRASPRLKVPAGSVGIAGSQTGIYPIETPGGWQLIGWTPLALFRPWDDPPALLRAGDIVRFRPVSEEEGLALQEASP